jgi:hypothetical protein
LPTSQAQESKESSYHGASNAREFINEGIEHENAGDFQGDSFQYHDNDSAQATLDEVYAQVLSRGIPDSSEMKMELQNQD